MLKLTGLTKDYKVADTTVRALDGVDLAFRRSEFVSVLGPSGCGKTTLLNIIGGLDKYTSGDVSVGGVSTKQFRDRDWDVYRNNRIGFVFQSYNLIPHQTVLGNVELALTIAGVSKQERTERAKKALDRVGLSGQYHKRPNQLSGGQCQRVAIARALVNEPDILLADEPTGALDTATSIQIMELIKEIAHEKLVIMVTHNPELAEKYSTRIIRLLDGKVVDDSMPYSFEDEAKEVALENEAEAENVAAETVESENAAVPERTEKVKTAKRGAKKAKMSLFTAFRLSAQNLFTKKARTIMTSIAGAIGIIGVSLVLAMSYGVHSYINDMQNDMLSGNPITVQATAFDMNALLGSMSTAQTVENGHDAAMQAVSGKYVDVDSMIQFLVERQTLAGSLMVTNKITDEYIKYVKALPAEDAAAIFLDYGLDVSNNIYTDFTIDGSKGGDEKIGGDDGVKNTRTMSLSAIRTQYIANLKKTNFGDYASYITTIVDNFRQMPDSKDYILDQYDVLSGRVAENEDEITIVLDSDSKLTDILLAQLGYYTQEEFMNLVYSESGDAGLATLYRPELDKKRFGYDELLSRKFILYPNNDVYTPVSIDPSDPLAQMKAMTPFTYSAEAGEWSDGKELKVVGVLMPKEGMSYGCLRAGFYYTTALAESFIEANKNSVLAQSYQRIVDGYAASSQTALLASVGGIVSMTLSDKDRDIPIGITYTCDYIWRDPESGQSAHESIPGYVGTPNSMSAMLSAIGTATGGSGGEGGLPGMGTLGTMSEMNILTLRQLGGETIPESLSVYPYDFEHKDAVLSYLDKWNEDADLTFTDRDGNVISLPRYGTDESGQTFIARENIVYTDTLSVIITMINTFIDVVTVALVGFTALSLVVSCVMIAIITYVSVVERVKEIGVIRSLGGRKKDVSRLFTAETFIIGLAAGFFGILVTYLLSAIINAIVGSLTVVSSIAILPWWQALIMIGVSVALTLISGVFPARAAAKKDPVVALRTE